MPSASLDDVVEVLRDLQLLESAHFREAAGTLRGQFPEPPALLEELVRRGWLTLFQKQHLLQGRGEELRLGPYVLLDRLGQGGMGEVFKARHLLLGRIVALKIIRKGFLTDPGDEHRFLREIQATAKLCHPNIVSALDAAQVGDLRVLALEFVEGTDLGKLIRAKGPLPVTVACDYIRQAALGLQHAQERGLVHRDIKPSNLLVSADGKTIKISDMGLVSIGAEPEETPLTKTGMVLGTPDYLAPEQATDARRADIRADLYSLGCTMYYLLTGQPPFPDGTPVEKVFKHVQQQPPSVRSFRADIPEGVAAIIRKLLAKKPDDRYPQPSDLIADLVTAMQATVVHPSTPLTPPPASLAPAAAPVETKATATTQTSEQTAPVPASAPAAEKPAAPAPRSEPPAPPPAPGRRKHLLRLGAAVTVLATGVAIWYGFAPGHGRGQAQLDEITNTLGMRFVRLPAGEVTLTDPKSGAARQVPIKRAFYLAVHPTTVEQFRAYVQKAQYRTEAEMPKQGQSRGAEYWDLAKKSWVHDPDCTWLKPGWPLADDQPVVCVSRYDAATFCYWLARMEQKNYRLPMEAELEYARHAGGTSTEEAAELPPRDHPCAVDTPQPNAWGVRGLSSNVSEWCAAYTALARLSAGASGDGSDLRSASLGTIWGDSWHGRSERSATSRSVEVPTDKRRNDLGFRLVMEAATR
jgi:serine/threonine-protein kinase